MRTPASMDTEARVPMAEPVAHRRRRTHRSRSGRALVALGLVAALAACDPLEPEGAGSARVEVRLTNATAGSALLDTARVDIGALELVSVGGDTLTLTEDAGGVDLLDIQDARLPELAVADVPLGEYARLRLVLEGARVDLARGFAFTGGGSGRDLTVPTGAEAGIELALDVADVRDDNVAGGIEINAGTTVLMLTVDVSQSFIPQQDPDRPQEITGITFTPAARVAVRSVAGSVSGSVAAGGSGASVAGLRVSALPLDDAGLDAFQTLTATASTDAGGDYTLGWLPPGRYLVNVNAGAGFTATPAVAEVELGEAVDTTGVDFSISADG